MNKEKAYQSLRMQIVTNRVTPGTILNEKNLMAQFSIGRSPLREILFRLQEENLIKPLPRLGYMVTTLDIAQVRELVELRRELEGFAAELIDRFGKLPREVNTLLLIVRIKAMCKRAGIAKLDGGPRGATIQFHKDKFASPAGLVEFIEAQNGLAKVRDNKIVVRRDWRKTRDKIQGAFAIARDLAEKVAAERKKSGSA